MLFFFSSLHIRKGFSLTTGNHLGKQYLMFGSEALKLYIVAVLKILTACISIQVV